MFPLVHDAQSIVAPEKRTAQQAGQAAGELDSVGKADTGVYASSPHQLPAVGRDSERGLGLVLQ